MFSPWWLGLEPVSPPTTSVRVPRSGSTARFIADGLGSGDASGCPDLGGCTSVLLLFGGAAATIVSLI